MSSTTSTRARAKPASPHSPRSSNGWRAATAPDGSRAAAEYVVHGDYLEADDGLPPANGQKYVLPGGAFFDIRDGSISRISNYYNLEDWLAQVR